MTPPGPPQHVAWGYPWSAPTANSSSRAWPSQPRAPPPASPHPDGCPGWRRPLDAGQGVDPPHRRVDEVGLVELPARLVLLRPAMVVDTEQHPPAHRGGGAEVDGRLAAVRADLQQGARQPARQRRRRIMERSALR